MGCLGQLPAPLLEARIWGRIWEDILGSLGNRYPCPEKGMRGFWGPLYYLETVPQSLRSLTMEISEALYPGILTGFL